MLCVEIKLCVLISLCSLLSKDYLLCLTHWAAQEALFFWCNFHELECCFLSFLTFFINDSKFCERGSSANAQNFQLIILDLGACSGSLMKIQDTILKITVEEVSIFSF